MTSPITVEELNAIKWYSLSNTAMEINSMLRAGIPFKNKNYDVLMNTLEKFKLAKHYKVYRGVDSTDEDMKLSFNKIQRSFLSTSFNVKVAKRFSGNRCCRITIILPKGTSALDITATSSFGKDEGEMLVRPGGTPYLLNSYTKKGMNYYDVEYTYFPDKVKEFEEQFKDKKVLSMVNHLYMEFAETYLMYDKDALYEIMKEYHDNIKSSVVFDNFIFEKTLEKLNTNNMLNGQDEFKKLEFIHPMMNDPLFNRIYDMLATTPEIEDEEEFYNEIIARLEKATSKQELNIIMNMIKNKRKELYKDKKEEEEDEEEEEEEDEEEKLYIELVDKLTEKLELLLHRYEQQEIVKQLLKKLKKANNLQKIREVSQMVNFIYGFYKHIDYQYDDEIAVYTILDNLFHYYYSQNLFTTNSEDEDKIYIETFLTDISVMKDISLFKAIYPSQAKTIEKLENINSDKLKAIAEFYNINIKNLIEDDFAIKILILDHRNRIGDTKNIDNLF